MSGAPAATATIANPDRGVKDLPAAGICNLEGMRAQNLRLTVEDIDRTKAFYVDILGFSVANFSREHRMLALGLADGFVLRFDQAPGPHDASGLHSIGIELDDFAAVDRLFETLPDDVDINADLRDRFADQQGPYGFIVIDPDGYRIKLFRYNQPGSP